MPFTEQKIKFFIQYLVGKCIMWNLCKVPNNKWCIRCLLHAFLSMSLFVLKNLFLSRDLFMISLFIVLFMKGAWFARTYYCFNGACFWIAWLSTALKMSKCQNPISHLHSRTWHLPWGGVKFLQIYLGKLKSFTLIHAHWNITGFFWYLIWEKGSRKYSRHMPKI